MTETAAAPPTVAAFERFRALRAVLTMDGSPDEKLAALAETMPDASDADVRHSFEVLSQFDPENLTFIIEKRKFEPYRWQELLPQITYPVLLMQGNPDLGGALDDGDAELAASLLPNCTPVRLQDIGHGIHHAQPAVFTRIVMDFLESL